MTVKELIEFLADKPFGAEVRVAVQGDDEGRPISAVETQALLPADVVTARVIFLREEHVSDLPTVTPRTNHPYAWQPFYY